MKIIQFMHPGAEHTCRTGNIWNTGNHRRKYIEVSGNYLTSLNSQPKTVDKLYFWGEWEAPSRCRQINEPCADGPHYIFNPHYTLPVPINAANTDPFVFGNQFYYCICKQAHYTSLRNLEPGDVILFGSCKNKQFVLDTLFVIKDKKSYRFSNLHSKHSNYIKTFSDVSLLPIEQQTKVQKKEIIEQDDLCIPLGCDDDSDYCLAEKDEEYFVYEAVMYEDREHFNGMFSYAPCLVGKKGENGFARPTIILPDFISPSLNQGLKINTVEETYQIWSEVTHQVLNKNFLMIKCELPILID